MSGTPARPAPQSLRDIVLEEMGDTDHVTRNLLSRILTLIDELKLAIKTAGTLDGGTTTKGRTKLREVYRAL